jgi:hypothetical protein
MDREVMFHVRLSEDEKRMVDELAKAAGLTPSDFVRTSLRALYESTLGKGTHARILAAANVVWADHGRVASEPGLLRFGAPPSLIAALAELREVAGHVRERGVAVALGAYEQALERAMSSGNRATTRHLGQSFETLYGGLLEWLKRLQAKSSEARVEP